jgi:integrase
MPLKRSLGRHSRWGSASLADLPLVPRSGTPSGRSSEANGEDIKTIQELLRHSNYKVTPDVYTQAMTKAKREAQTRVVRMILPEKGTKR